MKATDKVLLAFDIHELSLLDRAIPHYMVHLKKMVQKIEDEKGNLAVAGVRESEIKDAELLRQRVRKLLDE